ncbi:MAG TPA: hypothetical protein VEJ42_01770 [Streptosporangiaceae bacterium]|nr:hypothetical protein [Streptosporangiaceae bacterium]
MSARFARSAAAAAAITVIGVLSGCGSSGPSGSVSAGQVMSALHTNVRQAHSVHMTGSVTQDGQKITVDLSFDNSNVFGTISENGASFYLLSLNGTTYIKLDSSFLKFAKAPASACALICGRYLELPASSASQITGQLSMASLADKPFSSTIAAKADQSGSVFVPATVDGQQVLQFRQGAYALDVTSNGTRYPVLFTGPHGESVAFSEWNSVTLPPPPPASEVVNISKL